MLERVLEPEVMDTPAEARDYDAMDHAEVNRLFVDDLVPHLAEVRRRWPALVKIDRFACSTSAPARRHSDRALPPC